MRTGSELSVLVIAMLLRCISSQNFQPGDPRMSIVAASRKVHAFFYLWYGNEQVDGQWQHWNHEILPHWNKAEADKYPSKIRFKPPAELHSPFYPMRGCYSSRDYNVTREQFDELLRAGVGVAVLSWSGRPDVPGTHDTQGISTDSLIANVMDIALEVGMQIAFHLEPYDGRTALSVRYGTHQALHRMGEPPLPLFYVYDSYRIPANEWRMMLKPTGDISVRGTGLDGKYIGLWLESHDGDQLREAGFDGCYTYFAADGFTYGSSTKNWRSMAEFARRHALIFIPSVGPGYDDSRIRPWNGATSKDRRGGWYYDQVWGAAMRAEPDLVSITSYNEWGEGTQIEPAVPAQAPPRGAVERLEEETRIPAGLKDGYRDYGPYDPWFYLNRTAHWALHYVENLPDALAGRVEL